MASNIRGSSRQAPENYKGGCGGEDWGGAEAAVEGGHGGHFNQMLL